MPPTPPPPPDVYPPPPPAPVLQLDIAALVSRFSAVDGLIGTGLALLFILSFIGGWVYYSVTYFDGIGNPVTQSGTGGSLWDGFGYLPGLLLVVAMVFFVMRRLPRVRLVLPVADSVIWMGFAVVEIVLFVLHWVIDNGQAGNFTTPGWAAFAAVVIAAAIGAVARRDHQTGRRLSMATGPGATAPEPSFPTPPAVPSSSPVEMLGPDRARRWDGTAWQDDSAGPPARAPRSADGSHWWDGSAWRPIRR